MSVKNCIIHGEGWLDLVNLAVSRMPGLDVRIAAEMRAAATYTARLWFLLVILYVLDIDIHPENEPYLQHLLMHGYRCLYRVCYERGDVYLAMYNLHAGMEHAEIVYHYRDMLRSRTDGQDSGPHVRRTPARTRVDRHN